MEGSNEPFALPVTRRMVWGSTGFCNTVQRTKLLDQRLLEAPSLVRMKTAWDAKLIKPFVDQNLGHRGGPLVPSGNSYCEFAKHVSHDKDVLKPVPGGFQQGEIYCQDFIGS
ncbi:hypothetical protein NQZ68_022559 [Dissostichus eleginoides]|nr:hypothetical protein NQZ68_022559 [Dissostichus eleginoides]